MIPHPLTPLGPSFLKPANEGYEKPVRFEREQAHLTSRCATRSRAAAEGRLLVCWVCILLLRLAVGWRAHGVRGTTDRQQPRAASPRSVISATRADIVDAVTHLLATTFETHALYLRQTAPYD